MGKKSILQGCQLELITIRGEYIRPLKNNKN